MLFLVVFALIYVPLCVVKVTVLKCASYNMFFLVVFALIYVSLCVVKGQALADFLAECVEIEDVMVEMNKDINLQPWVSMFDGSKTREFVGVGIY